MEARLPQVPGPEPTRPPRGRNPGTAGWVQARAYWTERYGPGVPFAPRAGSHCYNPGHKKFKTDRDVIEAGEAVGPQGQNIITARAGYGLRE